MALWFVVLRLRRVALSWLGWLCCVLMWCDVFAFLCFVRGVCCVVLFAICCDLVYF